MRSRWGMLGEIGSAVAAAESDPEIRVVVLTGAGDRAFCAGMDLRAMADGNDPADGQREERTAAYLRVIDGEVTIPIVGAINGTAVAGGFELLLGCDVVVASSAAQFGLPEVKRGLFAGSGVMHIGRRVPLGIALELALTGDTIDAARAYELALVNAVVAPDDVLLTALAVAERIAANGPLAGRGDEGAGPAGGVRWARRAGAAPGADHERVRQRRRARRGAGVHGEARAAVAGPLSRRWFSTSPPSFVNIDVGVENRLTDGHDPHDAISPSSTPTTTCTRPGMRSPATCRIATRTPSTTSS